MRKEAFVADRCSRKTRARQGMAGVISDAFGGTIEALWKSKRLSTVPVDRAAAEEGVRIAYREAGLAQPGIVWRDGPVSLAVSWASAPSWVGPNAADVIIGAPYRQAVERLNMHTDHRIALLRDEFAHDLSCAISAALRAAIVEDAGAVRPSLLTCLHRLRSALANRRWPPGFVDGGWGQHELCWLGFTTCLLEMLEVRATTRLHGLRLVAENAGWILPHTHVCWLSDRPVVLSFDQWGRLHSSSGPALRYRDGWSVYAWKGKRVPSWIIDEPHRITLRWIDAQIDPLVRCAMIDIFTPERFVKAGGADCLASDAAGTLWARKWSYRGSVIDAWAAVEFPTYGAGRVGPQRSLFRSVRADLRTPAEALAWLYGPSSLTCSSRAETGRFGGRPS